MRLIREITRASVRIDPHQRRHPALHLLHQTHDRSGEHIAGPCRGHARISAGGKEYIPIGIDDNGACTLHDKDGLIGVRRLADNTEEIVCRLLRFLAKETGEFAHMRCENRYLRQLAQSVKMPAKRINRIGIHHERNLDIGGKEADKFTRLRLAPEARADQYGILMRSTGKHRLKCLDTAEISHPLIRNWNDHHLCQLRGKHRIEPFGHGERHQPRADAQRRLCRQRRRSRHAECARHHEDTAAGALVGIARACGQQLCRCLLCDE